MSATARPVPAAESALGRVLAGLRSVEAAGEQLGPEQLAEALGQLERLKALLVIRLTSRGERLAPSTEADRLLDAAEAAARLGIAEDTLYRRAKRLPFTVRLGRQVRFSSAGIERFIRARQGKA